jgi:hypothetical protein
MTIEEVITQLKTERAQLQLAIDALEGNITKTHVTPLVREMKQAHPSGPRAASSTPRKEKQHWSTTPEGRKRLAELMKRRWAAGAFKK